MNIQHVYADNPDGLVELVNTRLQIGWDLQGGLVTGHPYGLAQCMMCVRSFHEYQLVQAVTLGELDNKMNRLNNDGWDLWQGFVSYNGAFLQWMLRAVERQFAYEVEKAVTLTPAYTLEGLKMVEHAAPLGRILPYPLAVGFPSHVKNSTE